MITILEDFKPIGDTVFHINSQALVRNTKTGNMLTPRKSGSNNRKYQYDFNGSCYRVERLMKGYGVNASFDTDWFNSVSVLLKKAKLFYKKVPSLPLELTRDCKLRVVGGSNYVTPVKPKNKLTFHLIINIDGEKHSYPLYKLYRSTFGGDPPKKFTAKKMPTKSRKKKAVSIQPVVNCPYGKGWIKPLYGKMGNEFSPLDAYHESLTEAVMVSDK